MGVGHRSPDRLQQRPLAVRDRADGVAEHHEVSLGDVVTRAARPLLHVGAHLLDAVMGIAGPVGECAEGDVGHGFPDFGWRQQSCGQPGLLV
jgi:hypothetical protein